MISQGFLNNFLQLICRDGPVKSDSDGSGGVSTLGVATTDVAETCHGLQPLFGVFVAAGPLMSMATSYGAFTFLGVLLSWLDYLIFLCLSIM